MTFFCLLRYCILVYTNTHTQIEIKSLAINNCEGGYLERPMSSHCSWVIFLWSAPHHSQSHVQLPPHQNVFSAGKARAREVKS